MKEFLRNNYEWGDLLYEFPAETRLTVYRRLDIVNLEFHNGNEFPDDFLEFSKISSFFIIFKNT